VQVRSLGFATDLMVRRIGGSEVIDAGDHLVVRTATNPSFWWGNFVLVSGPSSLEAGLDAFRETFPTAEHVAIGVDGTDGAIPPSAASLGMEPDVSSVLAAVSNRLAAPPPVEAQVRVMADDDDWEQLMELRMAEALSEGPAAASGHEFQLARVAEARTLSEEGHAALIGAFVGDRLVSSLGVVSDGSGLARYQHVLTAAEYRRRGFAGRLVVEGAEVAGERWHATEMVIVADPEGPAIELYRSLGFIEVEWQVQLQGSRAQSEPSGLCKHLGG
jgi:GNAT superfamily N-acetyltransferase